MKEKLKKIKLSDILGIFFFLLALIPSLIKHGYLKWTHQQLFLIAETPNTARDNGYIFYKYMKEKHPEIKTYYAIHHKTKDFEKVQKYGSTIEWGSLKHYYYYMASTKNISSHKEGNPNHPLFTVLHLYLNLYNNRVFLQHGVLYQDFIMFHQPQTKFKIFITGAKGEYDFVKEKYEYQDEVKYTGLARFDNLYNEKPDEHTILLIPTWRRWLNTEKDFKESTYFKGLLSLINSKQLQELLEKYDQYLYFYPHLSTQKFINDYQTINSRVKILDVKQIDVQELLKKGSLLITDFSSIFTDFAYMHKPIIYYQYDKEEFYARHFPKGTGDSYYDFEKDGFGKVTKTEKKLLQEIEYYLEHNFQEREVYSKRINDFFLLHDQNNCQRIFEEIMGVQHGN